ncbi:MAG: FecR domain-containing protein [Bacteroidales bacterium]|nr:FecR domain-containing protein [Bacteroidales bacterium]
MYSRKKKHDINDNVKDLISLIKEAERIDEDSINEGWNQVKLALEREDIDKKTVLRRKKYLVPFSVAASIVALIAMSVIHLNHNDCKEYKPTDDFALYDNDSADDVILFTDNKKIRLDNDASVIYDKNGEIKVNNKLNDLDVSVNQPKSVINHIKVPNGKHINLTLSDGTVMYINAGTNVSYPSVFDKQIREIEVDGEVYLDVAHNADAPFIVRTKKMDIKVLGTTFDVSSYRDESPYVVLVRGKVEVTTSENERVELTNSQIAKFEQNRLVKDNIDVSRFISWKDNIMILDDKTINEVIFQLSRYYGRNIRCDNEISNQILTGKLDLCDSIEEVIEILEESINKLNIDGHEKCFLIMDK